MDLEANEMNEYDDGKPEEIKEEAVSLPECSDVFDHGPPKFHEATTLEVDRQQRATA